MRIRLEYLKLYNFVEVVCIKNIKKEENYLERIIIDYL